MTPGQRAFDSIARYDIIAARCPGRGGCIEISGSTILTQAGYLAEGKGFIGNENFEERADPQEKWIDEPVLRYLLKKFEKG